MSNKLKLILAVIIVASLAGGILFLSLRGAPVEPKELSLSADAYYVSHNEIAGTQESSFIENEDAAKISETLSGEYKGKKSVNLLEEYDKEYSIVISPVYTGLDVSKVDSYTKDPTPDEENKVIYGEVIYIFDKKTIGFFDAESQQIWIGKKKTGSIDIATIEALIEKNPPVDQIEDAPEEETEETISPEDIPEEYIEPSPYDTDEFNN